MAEYEDTKIVKALLDHLAELVLDPPLAVAWPNLDFPAAGETTPDNYLQPFFIPNTNQNPFLGDDDPAHHLGLFQVTVAYKLGAGDIAPMQVAGSVAAHFRKGTRLFVDGLKVEVYRKPSVAQPLKDETDARRKIPVTIMWQCFA